MRKSMEGIPAGDVTFKETGIKFTKEEIRKLVNLSSNYIYRVDGWEFSKVNNKTYVGTLNLKYGEHIVSYRTVI
jgi:hypothetical protein